MLCNNGVSNFPCRFACLSGKGLLCIHPCFSLQPILLFFSPHTCEVQQANNKIIIFRHNNICKREVEQTKKCNNQFLKKKNADFVLFLRLLLYFDLCL